MSSPESGDKGATSASSDAADTGNTSNTANTATESGQAGASGTAEAQATASRDAASAGSEVAVATKLAGASSIPTIRRAGYFENIFKAFGHINQAVSTEGRRLRTNDYVSVILLPGAAMLLMWSSWNEQAMQFRPYMLIIFNMVALYFIGARIGILRALTKRQTHLVWTMMCACFILGCTFSFLVYDFYRALDSPSGQ